VWLKYLSSKHKTLSSNPRPLPQSCLKIFQLTNKREWKRATTELFYFHLNVFFSQRTWFSMLYTEYLKFTIYGYRTVIESCRLYIYITGLIRFNILNLKWLRPQVSQILDFFKFWNILIDSYQLSISKIQNLKCSKIQNCLSLTSALKNFWIWIIRFQTFGL
jgi:hypothetical protein